MSQSISKYTPSLNERRQLLGDALLKSLEAICEPGKSNTDDVIGAAMALIVGAVDAGRMIIDRSIVTDSGIRMKQLYKWDSGTGKMTATDYDFLPDNPVTKLWIDRLLDGSIVRMRLPEASDEERAFLSAYNVDSFIAVPVFYRRGFWGCVAFQNIADEQLFSDDYTDLIKLLAYLFPGALANDETRTYLVEAEERSKAIFDATPFCSFLWSSDLELIDVNRTTVELFGFENKQECLSRFPDMSPKYQPDGQLSKHKSRMNLIKAFEEGHNFYDWTHVLSDGTLMPVEITLVKVKEKGEYFIAGFARDLLQIKAMESSIIRLRSESEKIYYDPLTGIFNRRFFDENLNRFLKTLSRSGGILSMLMIDIDYFKDFNDAYGHTAGDNCLKAVAETLTNSVTRSDDFVVRYGGEEFAVVLPNTDEEGACLLAEKMLESIRNCEIPHKASSVADFVTVSIGVTTGIVGNTSRADDFIIRADELLYMSKQNGRNRTTFAKL